MNIHMKYGGSVALDAQENLYVLDTICSLVHFLNTTSGKMKIVAGKAGVYGSSSGDGGSATSATFNWARSITYDSTYDVLYIVDGNGYNIRMLDIKANKITTIAGNGGTGNTGDGGPARLATLSDPRSIAIDPTTEVLYIATDGGSIRTLVIDHNTPAPSMIPSYKPTSIPTEVPTKSPSFEPSVKPTFIPTFIPSVTPTCLPSVKPTFLPSAPTVGPSCKPTFPTSAPSFVPTAPTYAPTASPSYPLVYIQVVS